MKVSAKADYAVRAAAELAAAQPSGAPCAPRRSPPPRASPSGSSRTSSSDLRHAGLVQSVRGAEGGHKLARPPTEITVADVIRAVDGPLAAVRGERPENVDYSGPAEPLQRVWIAVRTNLRDVVESVTLADLANGDAARRGQAARGGPRVLGHALKAGSAAARTCTMSPGASSSSSASPRVSCTDTGSPTTASSSSTRTSKPR